MSLLQKVSIPCINVKQPYIMEGISCSDVKHQHLLTLRELLRTEEGRCNVDKEEIKTDRRKALEAPQLNSKV